MDVVDLAVQDLVGLDSAAAAAAALRVLLGGLDFPAAVLVLLTALTLSREPILILILPRRLLVRCGLAFDRLLPRTLPAQRPEAPRTNPPLPLDHPRLAKLSAVSHRSA